MILGLIFCSLSGFDFVLQRCHHVPQRESPVILGESLVFLGGILVFLGESLVFQVGNLLFQVGNLVFLEENHVPRRGVSVLWSCSTPQKCVQCLIRPNVFLKKVKNFFLPMCRDRWGSGKSANPFKKVRARHLFFHLQVVVFFFFVALQVASRPTLVEASRAYLLYMRTRVYIYYMRASIQPEVRLPK